MINLINVTKRYDNEVAVESLSMHINKGELCVLAGESGCGKSTTLRMINRLIKYDEGKIEIDGKDITSYKEEELRRGIGYVIQNVGLFPHMNVRDNISVVPRLLKQEEGKILKRVKELIDMVGMKVDDYINKFPDQLSGGEAQRIGVARALAADPDIILMDEPFGAVDPINRVNLQDQFLAIQKELKKTVVFVTHDLEEVIKMGDKVAIMSKGVLQCFDTPKNILKNGNEFTKDFMGNESYIDLLSKYPIAKHINISDKTEHNFSISITQNAKEVLSAMISTGENILSVKDEKGNIYGSIDFDNILKILKEEEQ